MSDTGHTKHYSAADIQRYLDGKMLPAEMHALEQAALDDPFLADALEGMQQTLAQHDASVMDAHLHDLQRQVYERTRKQSKQAPVVAFRWWQAAAAAVIVITGGIWGYNYFQQSENKEPAQALAVVKQEEKPDSVTPSSRPTQPESTSPVADGIIAAPDSSPVTGNKSAPVLKLSEPAAATLAAQQKTEANDEVVVNYNANSATEEKKPDLSTANTRQFFSKDTRHDSVLTQHYRDQAFRRSNTAKTYQDFQQAKPIDYEQIVIAKQARDTTLAGAYTKPRERAMNLSRKELSERQAKKNPNALLSGFIVGRVTDQANNPLSNALLRVNDNREFFTDHKGNFKIPANDSVVNVAVGVSGYYTQNLQLLNNTYDNNISLNQLGVKAPNPQLNASTPIRIRGISTVDEVKSKEEYSNNYPEIRVQDAQPVYGWLEYQQYLEKNRKIPASNPGLSGTVVVSFQVDKKGALSDFKIEQSLDTAYDEEAIRLIKAGPSWKLLKGRKAKATVLVRF